MTYVIVGLGLVVALLGVLVVGLLRSHADLLSSLSNDAAATARNPVAVDGRTAPASGDAGGGRTPSAGIAGSTLDGGATAISLDGRDQATLLAFLTSGCATCLTFWNEFARGSTLSADTRLVVVTRSDDEESPAAVTDLADSSLTVIMSSDAWDDYAVPVAPYFVLVDGRSGHVVREGAASTWDGVKGLLSDALPDISGDASEVTRRELFQRTRRVDRADRELAEAGILPGDPRLYHEDPTRSEDPTSEGA